MNPEQSTSLDSGSYHSAIAEMDHLQDSEVPEERRRFDELMLLVHAYESRTFERRRRHGTFGT